MPARPHVPRVAAPVPEFRSRYVATRQPVLIDGLFDGQPIRKLATPGAARRAIGDMDFVVQWNYVAVGRGDGTAGQSQYGGQRTSDEPRPASPASVCAFFRSYASGHILCDTGVERGRLFS